MNDECRSYSALFKVFAFQFENIFRVNSIAKFLRVIHHRIVYFMFHVTSCHMPRMNVGEVSFPMVKQAKTSNLGALESAIIGMAGIIGMGGEFLDEK